MHAATTAVMLAKNSSGSVTLLYVTSPIVPVTEFGAMLPDPTLQIQEAGDELLRNALASLKSPVPTSLLNRIGAPAEVIADVALEGQFDLVVVGNKGRGAVTRMFLGSVADRVVHICTKPVLVVR